MDLFIYKSNSFYLDGKLSISIHQKEISKFLYIPFRFVSFHQQHTIKNIVLGRALCALQFGGENFQKTQISIVSKFAQSIMSLRNMSTPNYSNTSHIRKGINYSIQNFLFLMFVNHLLFWKQKRRIFLERKATFSLSQGDEATSSPRFNSPHLQQRFPQRQPTTTSTQPPERTRGQ